MCVWGGHSIDKNSFGKGINLLIPPAMDYITLLPIFYKDGLDIR